MFEIKFIKNPPTVENLKSLYQSEMYQNLLKYFDERSKHKLDKREDDSVGLLAQLTNIQRRYLVLNIPFDEVLAEFEKQQEYLLNFTILSVDFFIQHDDKPDGEFPKGEEPGKDDKSVVKEVFGVSKTFLVDKFCEVYLLNIGDKERLLHYLKTTRMPQAKKYAGQITKLYKQAMSKD